MYRTFSVVFLATLLITPSIVDADWFDDFESAMSGDTLGSLGYFNEYEIEQVSADGVNGSHGVKS